MTYQEALSDIQRKSDLKTGINTIYWLTEAEIKQKLTLYADDKVREALDRIEDTPVDWDEIETMQSSTAAAEYALSVLLDETTKIRRELLHQPNN